MKKYTILFFSIVLFVLIFLVNDKNSKLNLIKFIKDKDNIELKLSDYHSVGLKNITPSNIDSVTNTLSDLRFKNDYISPIYKYDPNQNYNYNFSNTKAKIFTLELKNNILQLASLNKKISNIKKPTIFLELTYYANSNPIGKYFKPLIILKTKTKEYNYTMEANGAGKRYINISHINLSNKINIIGKFATIPNQKVKLIILPKENLNNKTILILAPHPDDAEIAAYGLYSNYNSKSYVVTVTSGDAGADTYYNKMYKSREKQFIKKGLKRTLESISVPELGGISYKHCYNLGFFDARLASMHKTPNSNIRGLYTKLTDTLFYRKLNRGNFIKYNLKNSSNWNTLVDNLSKILISINPDIIVTPYPHIDKHLDHKYTTIALIEAIKKIDFKQGKLFMYTNHDIYSEYYPFGDRNEFISLPPMFKVNLYFNNIVSFPLSHDTIMDKWSALEAMSDLRYYSKDSLFGDKCKSKNENPLICKDASYFRRSVRPNELFFVVDVEKLYNEKILKSIY